MNPTGGHLQAYISLPRPEFRVEAELDIPAGQTVAIMGPSGAGKTTLLDAIAGLATITAGRIILDGRTLADADRRIHLRPSERQVGRLGQAAELFPHLSVIDNIAFAIQARAEHHRRTNGNPGKLSGLGRWRRSQPPISRATARDEAADWLTQVGLSPLAHRHPAALSGGQAKSISLLRTLAARPRLLLVDEPFTSLDVAARADTRAFLAEQLRQHPTTMIVVSHDIRDAVALSNHLIVLDQGRIIQQGPAEDVLAQPANRFVQTLADHR